MAPRVFAPDEEIPFHFTAGEINTIIAMIENTIGYPLRVTLPLREKISAQINEQPAAGDGIDPDAEVSVGPGGNQIVNRRRLRRPNA